MRPYINFTDDELIAEITEHFSARKTVATGGIAVIAGEGRRVEYTPANTAQLNESLRYLEYEARLRGLPIAGSGGAIAVEFR